MMFEIGSYTPPEGQRWQAGENEIKKLLNSGHLEFKKGTPFRRYFEDEESAEHVPFYCYMDGKWSSTSEGGKHILNALVGDGHGFDTVKPVQLIKTLIKATTQNDKEDIVLDFFVGSGTTAQALFELNKEDEGNRKLIIVQIKEEADPNKTKLYKYISDLTKLRINRVIDDLHKDDQRTSKVVGYRYLKIDSTNMKDVYYTPDAFKQADILDLADHIKEDRTSEDLLFQVMLDWGLELSLSIERKTVAGKEIFYVDGYNLVACFDELNFDVVDEIAKDRPLRFVSTERSIHLDHDKTNIKERFKQLSPDTLVKFL